MGISTAWALAMGAARAMAEPSAPLLSVSKYVQGDCGEANIVSWTMIISDPRGLMHMGLV